MIRSVSGFTGYTTVATQALTHCDDCELSYFLRGAARAKREHNYRQSEPLSRCFGNIVLICHANEEQWTENYREMSRTGRDSQKHLTL